MDNKKRILTTVLLLLSNVFALKEYNKSGDLIFKVSEDGKAYVIKTPPSQSQPDSLLVKLADSSIGTYPMSFDRSMISDFWEGPFWDQIPDKPDSFQAIAHNHALSDVTGLNGALAGKEPTITGSTSDNFWNGLKQWVNITIGNVLGLNDTITNHRTAIASKLDISDTSSLARKNHGHLISEITNLQDTLNNKQPLDTDLTAIAGLTHSNRHVIISNGTNWTRRALAEDDLPSLSISKITNLQSILDGKIDRLGVSPADFDDIGPNAVGATIFSSGWNKLNQPSGASYWSGFEFRHRIVEDYRSQIAMGTTGITPQLAIRNKTNGVWGSWYKVWHEGNFDPSTKSDTDHTHTPSAIGAEPAISGTAHKVLSIQSDGSGVKTGSIYDNGNVALIGKTTAIGGYKLEVEGNQLVNGKLVLGTRPANEHRWTLALDQHNTLYSAPSGVLNTMHNLYHDGSDWRYRYGSGSNSGGVLTTLAYNQFSVQVADNGTADQIATLTPAIHTNLNGNTAFGKNSFVGGNRLEVEGNALVNGNETITGQVNTNNINNTGFLQNTGYIASIYPSNSSVYYRDVYQYRTATASFTGTMKFTLPKTWSGTMLTFTIKGYNYVSGQGAWECVIGGCNDDAGWKNYSAEIRGSAPFSQVRLAHDGTKCCLLLGTTSTVWSYPQVAITEVFATYYSYTGWGEPYSMSFITSETGITNIVTPTTSIYGNNATIPNTALIGKTTATPGGGYTLEVEGNTLVNGNETITGNIEVEGNALVNGTLKANDFGDGWVDYSSSIQFTGFNEPGLTKKVYYKKVGKKITIVFYFNGTCNGSYFSLNHTTIGNIKSEHMLAFKSLYTGILHYNGYINGFASTIVESLDGEVRIRAITSDGNRFPDFSDGQSLTIRGSFTYYTD